jgi:hypothetical protein
MNALPRSQTLVVCGTLLLIYAAISQVMVQAQLYFTGPYGPGGTWNLYEHRGFLGAERFSDAGSAKSWREAHDEAIDRVEPFSGMNARGHLLALSGPTAQQENDFAAGRLGGNWAWIGLTDNEEFGGGEAGRDGLAGFGHPAGDGVGWKWNSGEVFDFANWYGQHPFEPDHASLNGGGWDGKWTMGRERGPAIVEYETRSPTPLALPALPLPPLLPGPPARSGAFGIREVARNGLMSSNGRVGYGELGLALRSLQNVSAQAAVRDYYAPVIDHVGDNSVQLFQTGQAGLNRPFELLGRGDVAFTQLDDFAMVAHGQILIPEGLGGDWKFQVTSDDGFELYIPGARFEPGDDAPFVTHYGSLMWPEDKGGSPITGQVSLPSGIHDIELAYFENKGQAMVELAAAPVRESQPNVPFAIIGAPAFNVSGRNPAITGGFSLKEVLRRSPGLTSPPPAVYITSITVARQLIDSPDEDDLMLRSSAAVIDHDNIRLPPGAVDSPHGRYGSDSAFGYFGNDFAVAATANLSVTTAGTYTFGFNVLDGGELTIVGAQFNESFGDGFISDDGQSLTLDQLTEDGLAFAAVDLSPGNYPLEFLTYNRDGPAIAELFVAPGRVEHYDGAAFALLSETPTRILYSRPAGLQLVPEPATVVSGVIGALMLAVIALRRLRSARV